MSTVHSDNTGNSSIRVREHRKHPRFDVQIPASIKLDDGKYYNGKTSNLSGNGAFFEYSGLDKIKKETPCTLTLFVEGKLYSEEITIHCTFKPHSNDGVGLEFKTMSTNDFINFIFLLSKKHPNPDDFISNISINPGVELLEEQ